MHYKSFIGAFLISLADQIEGADLDRCYALALNGGGSRGAYQAGVVWGFINYGNPADFEWDVVTGISAGAINTAAMSVWDKTDTVNMADWLSNMYQEDVRTHDVWQFWEGEGVVADFTQKPSILDNSPMFDLLDRTFAEFPEGLKRKGSMVGTVDANTGDYQKWFLDQVPYDQISHYVGSSASIPGIFFPQLIDGKVFVDGGTAMGVDPVTAIEMCLDQVGGDQSKVTLDIVLLYPIAKTSPQIDTGDTLQNILRSRDLKAKYNSMKDVLSALQGYPDVDYRYLVVPEEELCVNFLDQLKWAPEVTWPFQEQGRADAKEAMEKGKKVTFEQFKEKAIKLLERKDQ